MPLMSRCPTSLLAWANDEFGYILAAGTGDGMVKVFELTGPKIVAGGAELERSASQESPTWSLAQSIELRSGGIIDLKFAPYQYGLQLAVACDGGRVQVYAPRRLLPAKGWEQKDRLAIPQGFGDVAQLAWRPYSDSAPQMLAVGGPAGLLLYWYKGQRMVWELACQVQASVMGLDWAPSLGRPLELIATWGSGQDVTIWRLKAGEEGFLELETVAILEHTVGVTKARWDMFGISLAASTESNEVWIWKRGGDWNWTCGLKLKGVDR